MPEYLYNICFLLSDFIQIILQGAIITIIFNKKLSITRLLVFSLINSLVLSIPTYVNVQYSPVIRLTLYFLVMILTIKLVLSTSYFTSILGTGLVVVLSTFIEYVCMAIIKLSFSPEIENFLLEMAVVYYLLMRSIATIILLIVFAIVYYTKMSINTREDINHKRMLGLILNIIVIIIFAVPNALFFFRSFSSINLYVLVFNILMAFVLILLSVYNAKKFTQLSVQEKTIEYQEQYINSLNDVIDGLRGFKHDFNNIINVIGGYIALENYAGLKNYFRQLQNSYKVINNVLPLSTHVKDNPAIYGLLLSKISAAEIKDISFNINVNTRLRSTQIKDIDLYKIIGILLDNAFEAAEKTEDKYVEIFTKELDDEGIFIEISNSTSGKAIDVNMIYQKGYSTKEEHTGLGLWEVKKIISKAKKCEINTFINDNMFVQQLKIY